jgi:four helix bundle protein
MKIKRFEDLECWKEARKLMNMIYEITKNKTFVRDFRLKDQIIGSVISIMNNIAEGFDSQSNAEFKRFLLYSRRSVSETQNCLYVALDQKYIRQDEFDTLYQQAQKTRQLVDGLLRYLRKSA